ncbi:MAG: lantibiotic dehydratase [Mucilaginibacter sp.]|jgi:thiopeptide-type bacteriocin biosynthesis protein|uniref:lantibiotic dehydratase n=1 Tax=Mucilaginibacter sp. TaxID=1882438 RepID=UPI00356B057C
MKYLFSEHVLLRMPVNSPPGYAASQKHFLSDPFFLAAIRLASPSFYASLERRAFQIARLSEKEANSLQKYINRYCFRPTPFGLFASVSLAEWSAQTSTQPISRQLQAYVTPSMAFQTLLSKGLLDNELQPASVFESNPSIYRVMNEYRFFRTGLDENGKKRDYQLQSIAFSRLLKELVTDCRDGCSRPEISDAIMRAAQCTKEEAEEYADFLIDSQLLVNRLRPSITGPEYLMRLAAKMNDGPMKAKIRTVKARQNQIIDLNPAAVEKLEQDLTGIMTGWETATDKLNVILMNKAPGITLDTRHQASLCDGIAALELLCPKGEVPALTQFMHNYQQHFEGQAVPLLLALDPEAGVGYQQPESERNNPLLETLHIPYRNKLPAEGNWSTVHSLLMESWLSINLADPVIRLNDTDLERLKTIAAPRQMLGMSVLFRISNDKLLIENVGGVNAPALMGRFTVADEKIAAAAQSMAQNLAAQNPNIIFAELLHLSDPHTDNINRRAHVYAYELPITAVSTLPEEQQIQLSDLYIRMVNNTVILFSEKHQKIVIPRLTTAYNHSLNKLPLFRFLADLPYQHFHSALGLDLSQFFPNLHFYPRVEYKSSILSPATWIIQDTQLALLKGYDQDNNIAVFKKLSHEIRLARYFSLAEGDQELVFDRDREEDVLFFCNCIRQKKYVVLKEFLDQKEVRQYNAFLLPAGPLNLPAIPDRKITTANARRKYIPGSEWLYLKIYAPKIGINRLLLRLRPLIVKRYNNDKIRQWFFIRYEDHAPHIRLRLKVNTVSISEVLLAFKSRLEDRIQQHVIREYQIDVYTRELERYAAGGIENTERFFWASSELVMHFLQQVKTKPATSTHMFALYSTQVMINVFIPGLDEQISFTLNSFQQFRPEFTDRPIKVELDKKYRELTPEIINAFGLADPALHSGSLRAGRDFIKSMEPIRAQLAGAQDAGYLRSIIHMHLNRIFTDESRKQEMICYYLLHKYLLSVKGRNKRTDKTN